MENQPWKRKMEKKEMQLLCNQDTSLSVRMAVKNVGANEGLIGIHI